MPGTPRRPKAKAKATPDCSIDVEIVTPFKVRVALDENDIFNWITACQDQEALERLGAYARSCAAQIRRKAEPDYQDDDFRSRA